MSRIQGDPRLMLYHQKQVALFIDMRKNMHKALTGENYRIVVTSMHSSTMCAAGWFAGLFPPHEKNLMKLIITL